jgi:hypothetical protein
MKDIFWLLVLVVFSGTLIVFQTPFECQPTGHTALERRRVIMIYLQRFRSPLPHAFDANNPKITVVLNPPVSNAELTLSNIARVYPDAALVVDARIRVNTRKWFGVTIANESDIWDHVRSEFALLMDGNTVLFRYVDPWMFTFAVMSCPTVSGETDMKYALVNVSSYRTNTTLPAPTTAQKIAFCYKDFGIACKLPTAAYNPFNNVQSYDSVFFELY